MRRSNFARIAAFFAAGVSSLVLLSSSGLGQGTAAGPLVSRVGKEFWVNSIRKNYQWQPSISALSNGNFAVAWADSSYTKPDTDAGAVRVRLFTPGGVAVAKEFLVNTEYRQDQYTPKVAGYTGGFVVIWGDSSATGSDASGHAVSGRRFGNDGTPAGMQTTVNLVSQWDQDDPALVAKFTNRVALLWANRSLSIR